MEEQAGMSMFKANIPRFAKIILDETARTGKLRIPAVYAEEHGAELPNTVVLKLPNGSEWEVGVIRTGRSKIWFHSGWREFAKFNSLAYGHFLVFQYDRCGNFLVLIFDMSATEIDYKTKEASRVVKLECGVVDASDVPSNDQLLSPKTREKPLLRSSQPHKLRRTTNQNSETVVCCGSGSSVVKQRKRAMTSDHTSDNQAKEAMSWRQKPLTKAEKARVLARATATFKSENPSFLIVMQPSYVGTTKINLPPDFFRSNFKGKDGVTGLRVLDGSVWKVEYRVTKDRAIFTAKSWIPFVRKNSLEVGDVCAFELVQGGTESIFNVVIFRDTKDRTNVSKPKKDPTSSHARTAYGKVSSIASKAASAFTSRLPFFKVHVTASNLSTGRMTIPKSFMDNVEEVHGGAETAELWVAAKCWRVRIRRIPKESRSNLGSGWGDFAPDNSLEVGDVCVFELKGEEEDDGVGGGSSGRKMVFGVHIFRRR